MKASQQTIYCHEHDPKSGRKSPFTVVKLSFFPKTNIADRIVLKELQEKAIYLAKQVNGKEANHSQTIRTKQRIVDNCLAGVVSEYAWRIYLNRKAMVVREVEMTKKSEQIDLQIIANKKSIEIRSSFPRNGIPFSICSSMHEFDIIGPYANQYKPHEKPKDYYLRTLFHLRKIGDKKGENNQLFPLTERLSDLIKNDSFDVWLAGGATYNMMNNKELAKEKHLIPEDGISAKRLEKKTSYWVLPYRHALDTLQIARLIMCEC